MKIYYTFFLFFILFSTSAQEITDNEYFKKCRKEFSKKICLSDEDADGVLFYLDKCPKDAGAVENDGCKWPDSDGDGILDKDDVCPTVAGPSENLGCPWPDTDGDGVLDKDDKCPTYFGVEEENGCPKSNCDEYYKAEKQKFENFKKEELENKEKYKKLRDRIFRDFENKNKIVSQNILLNVLPNTFENDHWQGNECISAINISLDIRYFLDSLIINKETFLQTKKNFKKNIIPVYGENNKLISEEILRRLTNYHRFKFLKYVDSFEKMPENNYYFMKNKNSKFDFENKTIIKIIPYNPTNRFVLDEVHVFIESIIKWESTEIIKKYKYINHQWNLIEK